MPRDRGWRGQCLRGSSDSEESACNAGDLGSIPGSGRHSIVSPSICREVMGLGAMILVFWMLSFKTAFSLCSFNFIKRLFSSPSLSAIRAVSSAYLRLLIFILAILILVCASSSLAFCKMYSEYKLNKQGDSIQPWSTPFQIWNQIDGKKKYGNSDRLYFRGLQNQCGW